MLRTLVIIAVTANLFYTASSTEENEECAPEHQCNGKNQVWDDCPDCNPQTCESIGTVFDCKLISKDECKGACRCKPGYYRNADGECVCEDECPKDDCDDQCTGENEIWDKCPGCSPQSCKTIGKTYNCPLTKNCKPACRCKPGYYRNALNECISKENCLKCNTEKNEFYTCGPACDNVCATLHVQNRTHCPILNIKCNEKCYCEDGYARDCNNVCVPVDKCEENKCKKNEVYVKCPDTCKPQTCNEYGTTRFCPARNPDGPCLSKPACICKDGYLRNKKGDCIPKEDCTTCGGDPNAIPGCGINCNRHCSDYNNKSIKCIDLCKDNACDCKKDYVLDNNTGKCVKPKDCTPTCKAHEVYSNCIQGLCRPLDCTQKGQSVPCPKIKEGACKKGCVCAEKYLRAANGTCVREEDCDSCHDKCKKNERYVDCPSALCQPQKCSEAGFPVKCPKSDGRCADKPGCVCDEGYLRNSKGVCIPKEDCPSCGGDKNARPGCGVNCGKLCSTYKVKDPVCIDVCDLNGCDCIDGTVYDETKKKCVSPDDCPCTPPPEPECDD